MNKLKQQGRTPKLLFCDNGSEFSGQAMDLWAYQNGLKIDFSRPGKPTDNAFVESFNGTFRDECLNVRWYRKTGPLKRCATLTISLVQNIGHEVPAPRERFTGPRLGQQCFRSGIDGREVEDWALGKEWDPSPAHRSHLPFAGFRMEPDDRLQGLRSDIPRRRQFSAGRLRPGCRNPEMPVNQH